MENKRGNFYVLFCPWRQKRTKRAPLEGETHGILGEILGKEVSATFSVSCLGCNFSLPRKGCQGGIYVLFSPCREKSTKRAPLEGKTHGFPLKSPFSFACAERRNSAPLLIARQVAVQPFCRKRAISAARSRSVACLSRGLLI